MSDRVNAPFILLSLTADGEEAIEISEDGEPKPKPKRKRKRKKGEEGEKEKGKKKRRKSFERRNIR